MNIPDAHLRSESGKLLSREVLEWHEALLWDGNWDDVEQGGAWQSHRFACYYNEDFRVLLGVRQAEVRQTSQEWAREAQCRWITEAQCRWTKEFGAEEEWKRNLVEPGSNDRGVRSELIGDLWLWAGAWRQPPDEGWEKFAQRDYPEGSIVFPWGLLCRSRADSDAQNPTLFDLHSVGDVNDLRGEFLGKDLVAMMTDYVRATQYIRLRYENILCPALNSLEGKVVAQLEEDRVPEPGGQLSLEVTDMDVRSLNNCLKSYSEEVHNLAYDVRTVGISHREIRHHLMTSGGSVLEGSDGAVVLGPVQRQEAQMNSDLEYFRTTEQRGQRALDAYRVLVEIENTRTELGILQAQKYLAVVALFFATFIGLTPILEPKDFEHWWPWVKANALVQATPAEVHRTAERVVLSFLGALAFTLLILASWVILSTAWSLARRHVRRPRK